MDSAMRDMEQIQERHPDEGSSRKTAVMALALLALIALVFAMGSVLQSTIDETNVAPMDDPLAALDPSVPLVQDAREATLPMPEVRATELSFHAALTETTTERPEVAAAAAAAAAEYAEISGGVSASASVSASVNSAVADSARTIADTLPMAMTTSPSSELLARTLPQDSLVAGALPAVASQRPDRARASRGHDGKYTLQVVSYQTPEEARVFADVLQRRGHHAFIMQGEVLERGTYYRVRIGPFENMREATKYRAQFEQEEQMNTFVVRRRDS